jgi:RsiW-degrading membrane proteinase PrsW (M82 family)
MSSGSTGSGSTTTSLLPSWFSSSAAGTQWNSFRTSMSSSQHTKYIVIFLVLVLCIVIAAVYYAKKRNVPNTFLTTRLHRM